MSPATRIGQDTETDRRSRDHLHEAVPQRGIRRRDVRSTMIYTHVLDRGRLGLQSPADRL